MPDGRHVCRPVFDNWQQVEGLKTGVFSCAALLSLVAAEFSFDVSDLAIIGTLFRREQSFHRQRRLKPEQLQNAVGNKHKGRKHSGG